MHNLHRKYTRRLMPSKNHLWLNFLDLHLNFLIEVNQSYGKTPLRINTSKFLSPNSCFNILNSHCGNVFTQFAKLACKKPNVSTSQIYHVSFLVSGLPVFLSNFGSSFLSTMIVSLIRTAFSTEIYCSELRAIVRI